MNGVRMRILTRYIWIALASTCFYLAACGAGIQVAGVDSNNGGDTGNGGGTVTLSAPAVSHDDSTRATLLITLPDGGADAWESDNGGDVFASITPDCSADPCTYVVPGLNPNAEYTVGIRYSRDGATSETTTTVIDTTLQHLVAYGHAHNSNLGSALDVGDVNGDGYPDIVAGPITGVAAAARRVDVFLGGPDVDLVPWAYYTTAEAGNVHGSDVAIGDVTCDGQADLLIGENLTDLAEGIVHIFDGASVTAGAHDSDVDEDYRLHDDTLNAWFGFAFDTADDGSGCDDIVVGAPRGNGGTGEVFLIPHASLAADLLVDNSYRLMAGPGPSAGDLVENVGDVDGDGQDDVLFSAAFSLAFPNRSTTVRFTSDPLTNWDTITTNYNLDHAFAAGALSGDDFYISEGTDPGGFVNLYDGNAATAAANVVMSNTVNTFGLGAAMADMYPAGGTTDGDELLVGTDTQILVYYNANLGPDFDEDEDLTLDIPGRNIIVEDINGDEYPDIVSFEFNATDGVFTDAGAVHLYY